MSHKQCFEALQTILHFVRGNKLLMGGCTVLLCGDFRQILPIVTNGTHADNFHASLKSSRLWNCVKKLSLTRNMRANCDAAFSDLLLKIGNGIIPVDENNFITIPSDFANILHDSEELKNVVYPQLHINYINMRWLCERAILAPRNIHVRSLNNELLYPWRH
eukprot:GHVR01006767.1.p1 GENE.GHVR01006767.1~~GHVR01006767.1.p1  ORF type:complete len:162 (+),score=7.49 GHVR01006767.1:240-725(+)